MRTLHTNQIITRRNWQTNTYYVDHDTGETFVTPDGVGAYFYDTLEEAQENHNDFGFDRITVMYEKPDLDENP